MKKNLPAFLLIGLLVVASCRKDDTPPPKTATSTPPQLTISIQNMAGNMPLELNNGQYTNQHGDTFSVSVYKYYLSNLVLKKDDGSEYAVPESYYLIDESKPASRSIILKDIPAGSYTGITVMIGVDKTKNTSGAQTGALDPVNGMFWDWNTGYIMAKIEGSSPAATGTSGFLGFHIGGYGGQYAVQRTITLPLPAAAIVAENKSPVVSLRSDLLEWFKTPTAIDFGQLSVIASAGAEASMMADNYADMFSVDHVDN